MSLQLYGIDFIIDNLMFFFTGQSTGYHNKSIGANIAAFILRTISPRTMHEQGKKHKENVEKFLRNIRRKDHENRKEEEKTRRELERIERAAMKQYKKDIILEVPGASIASLKSTSNTNAPPVISSFSEHDVIYAGSTTNYTELAELSKSGKSADGTEATDQGNNTSTSQEAILQDDEEDEDPDDLRNFKVVEKTFPLDDQIPEDILKDNDSEVSSTSFDSTVVPDDDEVELLFRKGEGMAIAKFPSISFPSEPIHINTES
ncbi:12143_t:CDS:2 [Rhizophagus irregularis]|nr:12143_t:CDS:2 [Rhizophagus irregularis]